MAVRVEVKSIKQQLNQLRALQGKSEKAISRIVSDVRTRVPGWVATEVTKVYSIKKGEVTPAKAGKSSKPAGSIKVRGDTLETMEIVYRGRRLTPTHFGMAPKAPRESYTLKAEILNGNKVVLGQVKKLTKQQRAELGKNFKRQGQRKSPNSPIMLMLSHEKIPCDHSGRPHRYPCIGEIQTEKMTYRPMATFRNRRNLRENPTRLG